MGLHLAYRGSTWALKATRTNPYNSSSAAVFTVGVMFLEDAHDGVTRLGAFHEHIGCTKCDAFAESEVRVGPWVGPSDPHPRAVKAVSFRRPNASCQLFDVQVLFFF